MRKYSVILIINGVDCGSYLIEAIDATEAIALALENYDTTDADSVQVTAHLKGE
jgi:hypothetical protein